MGLPEITRITLTGMQFSHPLTFSIIYDDLVIVGFLHLLTFTKCRYYQCIFHWIKIKTERMTDSAKLASLQSRIDEKVEGPMKNMREPIKLFCVIMFKILQRLSVHYFKMKFNSVYMHYHTVIVHSQIKSQCLSLHCVIILFIIRLISVWN